MDPQDCTCAAGKCPVPAVPVPSRPVPRLTAALPPQVTPAPVPGPASARTAAAGAAARVSGGLSPGVGGPVSPEGGCLCPVGPPWGLPDPWPHRESPHCPVGSPMETPPFPNGVSLPCRTLMGILPPWRPPPLPFWGCSGPVEPPTAAPLGSQPCPWGGVPLSIGCPCPMGSPSLPTHPLILVCHPPQAAAPAAPQAAATVPRAACARSRLAASAAAATELLTSACK